MDDSNESAFTNAVPLQQTRTVEVEVLASRQALSGNGPTLRSDSSSSSSNGPSLQAARPSSNGAFYGGEASQSVELASISGSPTRGGEVAEFTPQSHSEPDDDSAPEGSSEAAMELGEEPEAEDGGGDDGEMSPVEAMDAVTSFVEAFDGVWNEVSGLLGRSEPEPEPDTLESDPQNDVPSFPVVEMPVHSSLLPPPPVPPAIAPPEPTTEISEAAAVDDTSSEPPPIEKASDDMSDDRKTPSPSYEKLRSLFGGRRRASRQSGADSDS